MAKTEQLDPIVAGCLESFRRCERIVLAVPAARYAEPVAGGQALGAHMRHCLDHLLCFQRGLETGVIEFDRRDRDERMESNPEAFLAALRPAADALAMLTAGRLADRIAVCQQPAPGAAPVALESTVARELLFLTSHTIHHVAIAMQIARTLGVTLPETMALAYSTASHRAAARV